MIHYRNRHNYLSFPRWASGSHGGCHGSIARSLDRGNDHHPVGEQSTLLERHQDKPAPTRTAMPSEILSQIIYEALPDSIVIEPLLADDWRRTWDEMGWRPTMRKIHLHWRPTWVLGLFLMSKRFLTTTKPLIGDLVHVCQIASKHWSVDYVEYYERLQFVAEEHVFRAFPSETSRTAEKALLWRWPLVLWDDEVEHEGELWAA